MHSTCIMPTIRLCKFHGVSKHPLCHSVFCRWAMYPLHIYQALFALCLSCGWLRRRINAFQTAHYFFLLRLKTNMNTLSSTKGGCRKQASAKARVREAAAKRQCWQRAATPEVRAQEATIIRSAAFKRWEFNARQRAVRNRRSTGQCSNRRSENGAMPSWKHTWWHSHLPAHKAKADKQALVQVWSSQEMRYSHKFEVPKTLLPLQTPKFEENAHRPRLCQLAARFHRRTIGSTFHGPQSTNNKGKIKDKTQRNMSIMTNKALYYILFTSIVTYLHAQVGGRLNSPVLRSPVTIHFVKMHKFFITLIKV